MRSTRIIAPFGRASACSLRRGWIAAAAVAALPLACFLPAARGATEADWLTPVSGNWTTPTLWSTDPFFPNINNPAGLSYNAVIAAAGTAYTVTLNSPITLAGLTINSPAATLNDAGSLVVNGGINVQSGEFLLTGNLANATITGDGGTFVTQTGGVNDLSNITVGAGVAVHVHENAVITNNLTLANGSITIGDQFNVSQLKFTGSQTFGGTGDVLINPFGLLTVSADSTLAIGSGLSLSASNVQFMGQTLTNSGTLTADGSIPSQSSAPQFTIAMSAFTNSGALKVINGATLAIEPQGQLTGPWTNPGSISETNGTLALSGSFSTSDLAHVSRTGGTILLEGTLNNTGQTLALTSSTGPYRLSGVMNGGTITQSGTGVLTASGGVLNGVTIAGAAADPAVVVGQESLPAGLNLAGGNVRIGGFVTTGGPITGTGTIDISDPSGSIDFFSTPGIPFAIPSGITVSNSGAAPVNPTFPILGTSGNAFSNTGKIIAQVGNEELNLIGNTLNNSGTIEAMNGASVTITGDLTNAGTLIENASSLNLAIPNFTPAILPTIQRTGGLVSLAATYNNAGGTLALTTATGPLGLINGGQIIGGTVTTSGANKLYVAAAPTTFDPDGVLSGLTLAGNLVVEEQAILNIVNNLTLQNGAVQLGTSIFPVQSAGGDGTLINFEGDGQLLGTGQVLFETTVAGDHITGDIGSSLTIGPHITVRSDTAGGFIGSQVLTSISPPIVNEGTISSQTNGKTIAILGQPFSNLGKISATNGGILNITNMTNSGQVTVSGTQLGLAGNIINDGTIALDHGAHLSSVGNFTQNSTGNLDFILLGAPGSNPLFLLDSGTVTLDGKLSIDLGNGFVPSVGEQWTLLQGTSVVGAFATEQFPPVANVEFQVQYSSNSVILTAIPEPGSLSVVALATGAVLTRRRRSSRDKSNALSVPVRPLQ